jgi:hypothetical protein
MNEAEGFEKSLLSNLIRSETGEELSGSLTLVVQKGAFMSGKMVSS